MTDAIEAGLYGRSFAAVYDRWYGALDDCDGIVASMTKRLSRGAVIVEFGSGTGRIAAPLDDADFSVVGLDISAPMLAQAPPATNRVVADMALVPLRDGMAAAVVIAYNTLFNLTSTDHQRRCLHEAARLLDPKGVLAIDNFIGAAEASGVAISIRPHHTNEHGLVAIMSEPIESSSGNQRVVGAHVELLPTGTFSRPWVLSYLDADGLDRLAEQAGLVLVDRFGDWNGAPYDPLGDRHVSWYTAAVDPSEPLR